MKKRILSIVLLPLFLFGCNNWLDVVPENDMVTIDTDFETRTEALAWLESCYTFLMGSVASFCMNEAFLGSDELVTCTYAINDQEGAYVPGTFILSGMQNSLTPYCDYWLADYGSGRADFYTAINLCNTFIDKIDQVYNMENQEKREWKAEVQAVKAYYYFELVRHYGPIILVPQNIDPNVSVSEMKQPRSHVDSCFAAIVKLCDEAAAVLPPFNQKDADHRTFFNKEAALALKAKALFYQASPLFNGNPDYANFKNRNGEPLFSTEEDPEKWRLAAEAAEAAIAEALMNGKHLANSESGATPLLTHMLNIEASTRTFNYESDEALWLIKPDTYDSYQGWYWTVPDLNSDETHDHRGTTVAPSMKMVEMFYTANGLPIDQDPSYPSGNRYGLTRETDLNYTDVVALNEDILLLHTKREPRFYAMIGADHCYWRSGTGVDDNYKITAYQGEDWGLKSKRLSGTVPENLTGYWMKKWSCSKADITNYSATVAAMGDSPFPAFRMAELYLMAAEAWNEYEGPGENAYSNLNEVRERAGIPTVQVSWEMARDKNKYKTQDGLRDIIRQEWNIEFAFEGMRYWNLRRWKTAHIELNENLYGWNVVGSDYNSFYNAGAGPVVVYSGNKFVAPRDYFYPIRSEEIQISGCVQNPSW